MKIRGKFDNDFDGPWSAGGAIESNMPVDISSHFSREFHCEGDAGIQTYGAVKLAENRFTKREFYDQMKIVCHVTKWASC